MKPHVDPIPRRGARVMMAGVALAALAAFTPACGGGDEEAATVVAPSAAPVASAAPAAGGHGAPAPTPTATATAAAATASLPPLPVREFSERDFAETDQNRDPFRTYAQLFLAQAQSRTTVQRKVLVDRYALDELKLVGIVTRSPARALLTDPHGLGWVAKVGDFVGKAELVHSGGPTGADVAVNWRVDRIREGDVVFVREDPSHPEIPPTTRVVALRTEEQGATRPTSY